MTSKAKQKVIANLNELLGSDEKNLSKCVDLNKKFISEKLELERQLNSVSNEAPSKMSEASQNVEAACVLIKKSCVEMTDLIEQIENQNKSTDSIYKLLQGYFGKIKDLERLLAYQKTIDLVQQWSDSIESQLSTGDIERAVEEFESLCSLCQSLFSSKCSHLKRFVSETTHYWNGILKKLLSAELEDVMTSVHWPALRTSSVLNVPSPESFLKLQTCIRHLMSIQLPEEMGGDGERVWSSLGISFPRAWLPMELLLAPLRKRFLYHFSSPRKTNRIDKPEWYFTQILTWIADNEMFVVKHVQPVIQELGINKSAKVELMMGLVELAVRKVESDLEEAQYDDALFSHLVDEALAFDRELRALAYPSHLPSASTVLTQAHILVKWLTIEAKFARDKMDLMLASETAWCNISPDDKVTEVAASFLAILSAITERYSTLIQPGHKLQFVEVQCELIDDLRVSLLQTLHSERGDPLHSHLPGILNTVTHLVSSLHEWSASPEILLLEHYELQYGERKGEGLFGGSLTLLEHLRDQLLTDLSTTVMLEVKARSRPYRRHRWFCVSEAEEEDGVASRALCPMLQVLSDKLHLMKERLLPNLFDQLWHDVASSLNTFLVEELILENKFSVGGGRSLERDVLSCILPLFQEYTSHPQIFFARLLEACQLLSMPTVNEATKRAVLTGNCTELMSSLNLELNNLTSDLVTRILSNRVDMASHFL